MSVVTLSTDFGLKDYYVAVIKGALLCQQEPLSIVDITHDINHYDIVQGAFIFRNAWTSFPEGTIHLLSINNFYGPGMRFLGIQEKGHFFIGPDNGLFSLIFDATPADLFELPPPDAADSFPLRSVFAGAAGHILREGSLEGYGNRVNKLVERLTFRPVISPSGIRGSIIHVDHYENVVINISKQLFEEVGKNRPFALFFKRHDPITRLSRNYYDVPVGEPLCLFNSSGFLEIAINLGKASSLLGLKVEDTVQIDFKP